MGGLSSRGLKPAHELALRHAHGTRMRYRGGCRCDDCRRGNAEYERQRMVARASGDWNGLVSADRARAHLRGLSKQGVGRRAVAAATDVAVSVIADIRRGVKTTIRARTERKILAVTPAVASDGARVRATATWRAIRDLLDEGYTRKDIARRLGYRSDSLQLGRRFVTVRNAYLVAKAHREMTE
jgi:hypothetical protein